MSSTRYTRCCARRQWLLVSGWSRSSATACWATGVATGSSMRSVPATPCSRRSFAPKPSRALLHSAFQTVLASAVPVGVLAYAVVAGTMPSRQERPKGAKFTSKKEKPVKAPKAEKKEQ